MMEELVEQLAKLQAERKIHETRADTESRVLDDLIKIAEEELASLQQDRTDRRRPEEFIMKSIDDQAANISEQIIDEWNPETMKKTLKFCAGTIKFCTTQSLKIKDETLVLTGLLDHTSVADVATKYIKGFNLTAVKKYMGVLDLSMGAAELIPKTTVKFEMVAV